MVLRGVSSRRPKLDDGALTDLLELLVPQAGGVLVGLDHRIKSVDSLKRKLTDMISLDPDLDMEDAAQQIFDTLRFTVAAEPAQYRAVLDALLAGLTRQHVTVSAVRNTWAGPGYRGINVRLEAGVNQRFEIQFHTRDSYAAAKATRGQYEELRLSSTTPARRAELAALIDEAFAKVPTPLGRYNDSHAGRLLRLQPRRVRTACPSSIRHRQSWAPPWTIRSGRGSVGSGLPGVGLPDRPGRLGCANHACRCSAAHRNLGP